MASFFPMKKNAIQTIAFPILDADGDTVSGATALDSERSIDGAAFSDCTSEATEIGSTGIYTLALTAAETNGDMIIIRCTSTSSGSKDAVLVFYTSSEPLTDVATGVNAIEAKLPSKSFLMGSADSDGGFDTEAKADVNTEVDNALDTDIPVSPTAGSMNDVINDLDGKLPVGNLSDFNETTDPVELLDSGGTAGTSASELVDDTWEELLSGHVTPNTMGETMNNIENKLPTNNIMGSSVKTDKDDEIDGIKAKTDLFNFTATEVDVNLKAIDGLLTTGNNATLNLKQLNVQNNAGSAIFAKSTGANGHGLETEGNGVGRGLSCQGGAGGQGLDARGGASGGAGAFFGSTVSHGLFLNAGTNSNGMHAAGGINGDGIHAIGNGIGHGMELVAGASGKDIDASQIDDIKTATDQLAFTGGNVHAHIKVEDDIDFGATKKASINTEVDNALDTDIPAVPTAGSINDVINNLDGKLPAGTLSDFDETADPVELLDTGGTAGTSAEELVDDIWDEPLTGATHNINTSSGRRLRQIQENLGYEGGAVWIDTVDGIAGTVNFENGTVGVPSLTIADARTIADSLNLNKFMIINGGTITLVQEFDGFVLEGTNWTLALGGQSLSGATIKGASVSGICTGAVMPQFEKCDIKTVTKPPCQYRRCSLDEDVILADAGNYFWDQCYSSVAGIGTPSVDFGATELNTNLNMRHYSGGMKVKNMGQAGTDNMTLEGMGQLIVDATCIGGTIALRGDFQVTDNSGGLVTIVDANIGITRKILNNRLDLDPTTGLLKLYDDDGTTVLLTWTVTDKTGGSLTFGAGVPARRSVPA